MSNNAHVFERNQRSKTDGDLREQLAAIQAAIEAVPKASVINLFIEHIQGLGKATALLAIRLGEIEKKLGDANLGGSLNSVRSTLGILTRGLSRNPRRPIRTLFLVHAAETWDAVAGIYEAMRAASDFEPLVATTHSGVTRAASLVGEEQNHAQLEAAGVPHMRFSAADASPYLDVMKALDPDIIFRQMPWDGLLAPAFSMSELSFARICYVPYGYLTPRRFTAQEPADQIASPLHTDQQFQRLAWRIFCETEMHKSMYVKTGMRAGKNVVVTGFTKFDRLLEAKDKPSWPITSSADSAAHSATHSATHSNDGKRPFRIIWAPHHSVTPDWLGFGTFVETHAQMLQWAKESRGQIEFVLKPHPALWGELTTVRKVMSKEYVDNFVQQWNSLANTKTVDGGDYGPLFAASDAMITDGVSFFSEYQLFEKPLLFLDSGRHFGFNEAGEVVMRSTNNVKSVAEARALCERLRAGEPDPMKAVQKEVLPLITPFPGQTAQRALQAIREGLELEEGHAREIDPGQKAER